MTRICWIVCVATLSLVAAEPEDPTVHVQGLRLIAPGGQPHPALKQPFDSPPGTTVALVLRSPAGGMVKIDKLNSALSVFADDKGNDLTHRVAGSAEEQGLVGLSITAEVTPDGKFCSLEATAPALPAPDATQIKLEGSLAVLTGTKQAETVLKNVALRDGSKFTVGTLELTIDDTGKPEDSLEPFGLTVRSFEPMHSVAAIKFFGADGKEIPARRSGVTTTAKQGALTEKWIYRFIERVDTATVKVYTWSDLAKVKVPFKIQTGIGVK